MNKGRITQVMGPVVDVVFEDGDLPFIKDALEVVNNGKTCIMEVAQHLGNNEVRCLMLSASEGLCKDMEVTATGAGIQVPVGEQTLGRLFNVLGETIDDAVGEAYDKVARLIGLPYPGGPKLDKLAQEGNPHAFKLPEAKVGGYDFSFSGLKTAVLRLVKSFDGKEMPVKDICASFQECVSATLLKKVKNALAETGYKQVVLAGGVAANSEIRKKIFALKNEGYEVFAPVMKYCTDNASMVASSAYFFDNTFDDINVEVFSRT